MSAGDFRELIEALDLHSRYNLRRTADRIGRLRSFLSNTRIDSINMAPPTPQTPPTPPPPQQPSQQQLYLLANSARSLPVSRFTGFVPEGVPNRDQLMSYDVNRWLCDAETRCHVKGVTDDVLRIKEAKLAVSSEVGDAAIVLNTGRMNQIKDYAEFKNKCLKFWRPASERDRYHALSDFLSVEYSKSLGVFASNLERARMRILQDLEGDTSFSKGNAAHWAAGNRNSEILVSLDEIVNYFSWGVLFKAVPPTFREALRKVEIKYSDDYLDILSSVQSELLKLEKGVKIEVSAFASKKDRKQDVTSGKAKSPQGSQKSQDAIKCYRCEKIGHISRDCRVKLSCNYCKRDGHIASRCFTAIRKNKQKASGRSDGATSNSHVVDAGELPNSEGSS